MFSKYSPRQQVRNGPMSASFRGRLPTGNVSYGPPVTFILINNKLKKETFDATSIRSWVLKNKNEYIYTISHWKKWQHGF